METIQVVLDAALLKAANVAAKRARVNRSALIRQALREHLERLRMLEIEARDRAGYEARSDRTNAAQIWERVAAWPEQ